MSGTFKGSLEFNLIWPLLFGCNSLILKILLNIIENYIILFTHVWRAAPLGFIIKSLAWFFNKVDVKWNYISGCNSLS